MIKSAIFVFMVTARFTASKSYWQDHVFYGSNHGKYVSISNKKIYYEEYNSKM